MKIKENELRVRYNTEEKRINIYRTLEDSNGEIINTSYSLSDLKTKGLHESGCLIGEDILMSLKGTREELLDK